MSRINYETRDIFIKYMFVFVSDGVSTVKSVETTVFFLISSLASYYSLERGWFPTDNTTIRGE